MNIDQQRSRTSSSTSATVSGPPLFDGLTRELIDAAFAQALEDVDHDCEEFGCGEYGSGGHGCDCCVDDRRGCEDDYCEYVEWLVRTVPRLRNKNFL